MWGKYRNIFLFPKHPANPQTQKSKRRPAGTGSVAGLLAEDVVMTGVTLDNDVRHDAL